MRTVEHLLKNLTVDLDEHEAGGVGKQLLEDLRDRHDSILPGYHMNKKHWNTLVLDGSLPAKLVEQLIAHSWELVVEGLPKKVRAELEAAGDS